MFIILLNLNIHTEKIFLCLNSINEDKVFCKDKKIYLHWLGSESRQVTSDITVRFPLTHIIQQFYHIFYLIFVILKKGETSFPRKGRE